MAQQLDGTNYDLFGLYITTLIQISNSLLKFYLLSLELLNIQQHS